MIDAGYFDVEVMVRQMNGPMPLSERNLKDIGIKKPGHRRYLLIKLEEEAGLSSKIGKNVQEKQSGCLKCCTSGYGTRNLNNSTNLNDWLDELGLGHLYELFIDAGFSNYDMLLEIQNSLHPLTSRLLDQDVKISNLEQRMLILRRLQMDIGNSFPDPMKIAFDPTQKIGCGSCNIS